MSAETEAALRMIIDRQARKIAKLGERLHAHRVKLALLQNEAAQHYSNMAALKLELKAAREAARNPTGDYRALLAKYLGILSDMEGTTFVDKASGLLTAEESRALLELDAPRARAQRISERSRRRENLREFRAGCNAWGRFAAGGNHG